MKNNYGENLTIEIVNGGFILTYPLVATSGNIETTDVAREVFISPRKLNQKIKDVIASLSLVADTE